MTYEPLNELGITSVEQNFSFNLTFTLENTTELTETIEEIILDYDNTYISHIIDNNVIKFYGNAPLDIFDKYMFKYVDKGSSDKLMSPVISKMADTPDNKDVFELQVDSRSTIEVLIKIDVKIKNTTKPIPPLLPVITYINYEVITKIIFGNSPDKIRVWLKDYFENRY